MATSARDPLLGSLVDGRYEVLRRVARGGMATVYLATDLRLDRRVALKVMHPHLADGDRGDAFVARFQREARAAARLSHPNLVGVYDQGVDGDTSYLTMEYVEGSNLRHRLHDDPGLSVAAAFDIASQVLEALAAVHEQHLVHRDIKPENILLTRSGKVKVTDFGLARAISETSATTTGSVMGTVAYLAPELISAQQNDARADVYAVGMMLAEMLTGQAAFPGLTPLQVAMAHVNTDVEPPSRTAGWLPAEVDDLVARLSAREPGDRPADAHHALAEVTRTARLLPRDVLDHHAPSLRPAASSGTESTTAFAPLTTSAAPDREDERPEVTASTEQTVALDVSSTRRLETLMHDQATITPTGSTTAAARPGGTGSSSTATRRAPGRRRTLVVIAVIFVLLAGGAAGTLWYQTNGPGAYTSVPDHLAGMRLEQAERVLHDTRLSTKTAHDYSDTVSRGEVISADPASGARIRKDATVTLRVSRGIEHLTVPDHLVGQRRKRATSRLTDAGFTVAKPKKSYSDTAPSGEVIGLNVTEGSSQPHDTPIRLTVSRGPHPVTIPDLSGTTKSQAKDKAGEDGLHVKVTGKKHDDKVPQGQVLSQSPDPGTQGHRTDTVDVVLSRGPVMVAVPNVVMDSEDTARQTLQDDGFDIKVNRYLGGLLHTVRFQSPAAGKKVPKGTTVTLTVW